MTVRNGTAAPSRRMLITAAAAMGLWPAARAWAQPGETLRIGFLTVNTGPLVQQPPFSRDFPPSRNLE